MALASYSDLQTAVADYLNRADLTNVIPNFVTLAEAKFNRKLRVINMETRSNGTIGTEFASVPTDYLETRSFKLQMGSSWLPNLQYVGEEEIAAIKTCIPTGFSKFYTIVNGAFDIVPAPGAGTIFELNYYAQIPALSVTNTSNWLLVKSPDLYLYGSLLEAEAYLKNDERLPIWSAAWQSTIDDMMLESQRAKASAIQLTARRRSFG